MPTAAELLKLFKAVPRDTRDAHQAWAIRVWRSLSWLARAEQSVAEDRFINAWIAFNALYGRLNEQGLPDSERHSYKDCLRAVCTLDKEGRLADLLTDSEFRRTIERLVINKFLDIDYWTRPDQYGEADIENARSKMRHLLNNRRCFEVLKEVFDRLYVMRQQIMHGASTKGGKLNRLNLDRCARLLMRLTPLVLEVAIRHGMHHPWRAVCFPPVK